MTPEAQRIAIACPCWWVDHEGAWHFKNGPKMHNGDPLQDLNAMHEAEKTLTEAQRVKYGCILIEMFHGPDWRFDLLNAPAPQRAEAFLKALNLWTTSARDDSQAK